MSADGQADDPQEYCLSTYVRLNDVKRFVIIDSKYQPPWLLAKGHTTKEDGVSCLSKEWQKRKNSHVDWWLYVGAKSWKAFEEVSYDDELRKISAKES